MTPSMVHSATWPHIATTTFRSFKPKSGVARFGNLPCQFYVLTCILRAQLSSCSPQAHFNSKHRVGSERAALSYCRILRIVVRLPVVESKVPTSAHTRQVQSQRCAAAHTDLEARKAHLRVQVIGQHLTHVGVSE